MGNNNKLHRPFADILKRPGKVQRALSHAWDVESQPAPHPKAAFLAIGCDAHGASVALRRKSSFSGTSMSNSPDFPRPTLFAGQQRFLFGQLQGGWNWIKALVSLGWLVLPATSGLHSLTVGVGTSAGMQQEGGCLDAQTGWAHGKHHMIVRSCRPFLGNRRD